MVDHNETMICAIYAETDTDKEGLDLAGTIAQLMSGKVDPQIHYSVIVPRSSSEAPRESVNPSILVDVVKNPGFIAQLRSEFPDGFLYFRYRVEVYAETNNADSEIKQVVERILNHLWSMGYPAVAVCDFEEELPHKGGYKSRLVPWPAVTTPD
jgi:hypothetical protein